MKICWDTLEGIKLTRNGVFLKNGTRSYIYKNECKRCGDSYLTQKGDPSDFCGRSCANTGNGHWAFGKHLSVEHKKKLSIAFTGEKNHFYGKIHTKEVRKIISEKSTGRKASKEAKEHMSKTRVGKPIHSEEYKQYLSKKISGEGNPCWKGGISCEPYCYVWLDKEYKESIKERDNYICQNPYCSKENNKLVLHHIEYNKKKCNPKDIITVCNSCNARANIDREWHTAWYRAIMHNKYGYVYDN